MFTQKFTCVQIFVANISRFGRKSRKSWKFGPRKKISCYTVYKHVTCYLGNTKEERYVNMGLLGDGLDICELKLNCMINS